MRRILPEDESQYLSREIYIQMQFRHECILQILGYSEDPSGFPLLIMELGGQSLDKLIMDNHVKYIFFSFDRKIFQCGQMPLFVGYC